MMDTDLTAVDPAKLAATFDDVLNTLNGYYSELRSMQPSPMKANLALEYAREAKRYLDLVEGSDLRAQAKRLYDAHKYATSLLTRVKKPGEILLKLCQDIRSDWEVERRRRNELELQKREAEANRQAAEARAKEIEHLKEIGRAAEAEARAKAPVVPIAVSVDPDAGKPQGEIMVEVWMPKKDEDGNIVFSDLGAYLKWIAERPEMHYLIEHKFAKLKKLLTDNRGMLQPPGLAIDHKFEARTRKEQDDE